MNNYLDSKLALLGMIGFLFVGCSGAETAPRSGDELTPEDASEALEAALEAVGEVPTSRTAQPDIPQWQPLADAAREQIVEVARTVTSSDNLTAGSVLFRGMPIKLLGDLKISGSQAFLENLLERTPQDHAGELLRLEIFSTLVKLGNEEYLEDLRTEMEQESGLTRLEFAKVLSGFGDNRGTGELEDAVYLRDSTKRWYAVLALAREQHPLAKAYLEGGLRQPQEGIRFDCAWALAFGGWSDGRGILEEAFKTGELARKLLAAEALTLLGDTEAAQYLTERLVDGSNEDAVVAIKALGASALPEFRDELEVSVDSLPPILQAAALLAIGNIGDTQSLPFLMSLAQSDRAIVSLAANAAIVQVVEGRDIEFVGW